MNGGATDIHRELPVARFGVRLKVADQFTKTTSYFGLSQRAKTDGRAPDNEKTKDGKK